MATSRTNLLTISETCIARHTLIPINLFRLLICRLEVCVFPLCLLMLSLATLNDKLFPLAKNPTDHRSSQDKPGIFAVSVEAKKTTYENIDDEDRQLPCRRKLGTRHRFF